MESPEIFNTPAMRAPDGQQNNLRNPYSQQTSLISAAAVYLAIATLFVAIRTFTKVYVMRAVRIEDCKLPS